MELAQDCVPVSVDHHVACFLAQNVTQFLHISYRKLWDQVTNLVDAADIFGHVSLINWGFKEVSELVNV